MARSPEIDYGKVCGTCGQSELGVERLKAFGFRIHYCKDCDPEAPPKPEPKSLFMTMCDVHEALSVDPDTGLCSLCEYEVLIKRDRRRKAAARSKKRKGK